jgi:hypothetical protein
VKKKRLSLIEENRIELGDENRIAFRRVVESLNFFTKNQMGTPIMTTPPIKFKYMNRVGRIPAVKIHFEHVPAGFISQVNLIHHKLHFSFAVSLQSANLLK